MAHVAVLRLSVVNLVSVVVVAVLRVSLVALRTGPVPLTQGRHHPLLAWDVVGLHEGHAGQHRLTAQQPGLTTQTTCQSRKRGASRGLLTETGSQVKVRQLSKGSNREMRWHYV